MADHVSVKKRSQIMAAVGSKNTAPELKVRSMLHRLGYRFRLHVRTLPGKPDIVLPRHHKVILVHGCFWHGHPGCSRSARPASNNEYWRMKLERNLRRDAQVKEELEALGWNVLVVWQCEARAEARLLGMLLDFLLSADCA